MYMTRTKAICAKGMRTTFDADYPVIDMRNMSVELEYPVRDTEVPAIWIDFDPIGPLKPVGVNHVESISAPGGFVQTTRWSFAGNATFTVVAMSSLERDRMFDEVAAIIAFSQYDTQRSEFRRVIETDPLIQLSMTFDQIDQRGFSAAPGTPWGTDDMMYEATLAVQCIGEFVNEPGTTLLVPIERIRVFEWVSGVETDPTAGDGQGEWLG